MSQESRLSPQECARNAGIFLLIRMLLGSILYVSLGTIFPVPTEGMLAASNSIKANVFFFIGLIAALFFLSLFSLIVSFPLNNVLKSINHKFSLYARNLRVLDTLLLIAGIVLLIAGSPVFLQVLYLGQILLAIHLIIVGYLTFISGYLNRVLGISLVLGGTLGYFTTGLTQSFVPNLALISMIGSSVAIVAEIALAVTFVVEAMKIKVTDNRETVLTILKTLDEATTAEIMEEAAKVSQECTDRVPGTLSTLETENLVTKKLSKEKNGFVWSLVD